MKYDWPSAGRKGGKFLYSLMFLKRAWEENKTTLMMSGGFMRFEDYTVKYDYKCKECGKKFEVESLIRELGYDFPCPKCKSLKTRRIITQAPQVQFKGKGFYINDHKK